MRSEPRRLHRQSAMVSPPARHRATFLCVLGASRLVGVLVVVVIRGLSNWLAPRSGEPFLYFIRGVVID